MYKHILTLTMAVSFLLIANIRADMITFPKEQMADYFAAVGSSDWVFGSLVLQGNTKAPMTYDVTLKNTADDSTAVAKIVFDSFNGGGGSGAQNYTMAGDAMGMSFEHNSANDIFMDFRGTNIIDSFFFDISSFTSDSKWGGKGLATVIVTSANGEVSTTTFEALQHAGWLGFIFDEDDYLATISLQVKGSPNIGWGGTKFYFGDGGINRPEEFPESPGAASTPEPATLVLMGLGLAGVGLARRRMKK